LTNIKNFDGYTLNHSVNVCVLSISLGKKLGLDRRELVELGLSAFFHDFGKLDIPKEILLKPGSLTSEERRIIEKHPHLGAEKLVQLKEFRFLPLSALSVAMEHHSREDRTGYPKYRKKPTINLFSKIVKITDVYDALTTERPYRPDHMSQEEALMFMQERSGTEFDPLLLKVFVHMMGDVPVGSLVLLDTGEIGIAYEINPSAHFRQRPKVKLITDPQGNKKDGDIIDLTQKAPERQEFERSIIKILDTRKYPIKTADYFVAQAE
jgi:HD-GYP domain-containing protein (c-di-GMP phosphodiesterase class II)